MRHNIQKLSEEEPQYTAIGDLSSYHFFFFCLVEKTLLLHVQHTETAQSLAGLKHAEYSVLKMSRVKMIFYTDMPTVRATAKASHEK